MELTEEQKLIILKIIEKHINNDDNEFNAILHDIYQTINADYKFEITLYIKELINMGKINYYQPDIHMPCLYIINYKQEKFL